MDEFGVSVELMTLTETGFPSFMRGRAGRCAVVADGGENAIGSEFDVRARCGE